MVMIMSVVDDAPDDGHDDDDDDDGHNFLNLHPYQALPAEARLHHRQSAGVSFNRPSSSL